MYTDITSRVFQTGTVTQKRRLIMKICIFGAGAIGGYLAVELALAGNEVCAIARGAHLDAIRKNGLTLRIGGNEKNVRIDASSNPADFGPSYWIRKSIRLPLHQRFR